MTKEERTKIYYEPQDEVLNGINSGNINNLRLVDWHRATHGYSFHELEYILEKIPDEQVKIRVLKAAHAEWEHKNDDIRSQLSKEQERYQSDITIYSWYDIRRKEVKDFGYECKRRIPETEPPTETKPFIIDKRLKTGKAPNVFRKFAEEGFIEVREGKKLKWLQGTKADFLCFVEEALDYLHLNEAPDKWNLFEKSFEIYDNKFKPTQLLSYSKKENVSDKIEGNKGLCRKIKGIFTRGFE